MTGRGVMAVQVTNTAIAMNWHVAAGSPSAARAGTDGRLRTPTGMQASRRLDSCAGRADRA